MTAFYQIPEVISNSSKPIREALMPVSDAMVEAAFDALRQGVVYAKAPSRYAVRLALEAALSLPQGAPEWQTQETLPNDDTIIEVRFVQVARWNAAKFNKYHPDKSYLNVEWRQLPASPDPEGL